MNILQKRIMTIIIVILFSNIFAINTFNTVQACERNLKNVSAEDDLNLEFSKNIDKNNVDSVDMENENYVSNYNYDDFKMNKFNENKYLKDSKGKIVFGTINGVSVFDGSNVFYGANEFDIEGTNTPIYSKDETINEAEKNYIENSNNLNFEWYSNMIKIKFSIPEAYNSKNIKYHYKLLSVDKEWKISDENVFVYNNLNPGKYLLKIKAINDNDNINIENQVEFIIKPQIWKSPSAISLYAILILLIIYLSITKVKDLDRMVEKRTKQLKDEMDKNRKLFNKVIDLERRKNNYFVNLSHELRTPLNVISSTEQLIVQLNKQENGIEKEKLDYYMKIIKRNSSRLLKLINNIIDTNKIESGRYELNLEENDIVYLVEESSLSLKDYIENKGIHLIIDPEVEEKTIMCDSYEIERCIVNLVSNAAKFTPEGGEISVILKEVDDKVIIIIKDNGIGIEPKYHKAIFDRFNQIVDANSETKGGSGLGLTITKHIIDLHKGEIYVNSDIGEGCEFVIILPTNLE